MKLFQHILSPNFRILLNVSLKTATKESYHIRNVGKSYLRTTFVNTSVLSTYVSSAKFHNTYHVSSEGNESLASQPKKLREDMDKEMSSENEEESFVIRVRGLPRSATRQEIQNFFSGVNLKDGVEGIHMTLSREGRPSGQAYIELEFEDDLNKALEKNRDHMGHRYIEVFKSKKSKMDYVIKRSGDHQDDGCVRLRGLPFRCSEEEISQFFSGLEIVPNGISLLTDYYGRSTGEAFVQFSSREIAEKAMEKHKEEIGNRYIEIFKSSLQEKRMAVGMLGSKMRRLIPNRPGPYDRSGRFYGMMNRYAMGRGRNVRGIMDDDVTVHRVCMQGLPFKAIEQDIYDFFRPLNITPVSVRLKSDRNGRPSGEADVEFATHEDAVKAMTKDKAHMQHHYIELFLNSSS